ncbi:MAG TPA: 3-deoxy-manno-octulosonate cytidylyltransferase, partial [Candidatus Hydrogenedentes bacterium]|nr:3-deoxy-manno-octulosonate cytidylyltransferase [Candidatus Hydrogenedentota bacterium]
SGTDRAAEVAATSSAQLIVNVQADEPLIDPRTIDAAIAPMLDDSELAMVTVKHRITDLTEVTDPNVVKVVCDANGRALYFSRSPIPHIRDAADRATAPAFYWKHLGLYVYRREFLLAYAGLPRTPLEQLERLEQLRALENGCAVAVVETPYDSIGVDTPEDLARVAALLGRQTVGRSD